MTKIKILTSYHKPSVLLNSNIFVPIHVGRELKAQSSKDGLSNMRETQWLENNMIGDNTGDNISLKNREYCELTAMYWAWKNQVSLNNPDYIGFMHYRRHLCFDLDNTDETDTYGLLNSAKLDDDYIAKNGLDDTSIQELISGYDIVTVEKTPIKNLGSKNNYDHYCSSSPHLHIEDYEKALSIVKQLYPEYTAAIANYNNSLYGYFTNIFVMKTELFNDYAQWLFSILEELEKRLDLATYNTQEARVFGYISEWLFGIWYTKNKEGLKTKELKRTLIRDTDLHQEPQPIDPAFDNNNIAICMATDENYVNYLIVALKSIIDNANQMNNYDIVIIHSSMSQYQQNLILGFVQSSSSNFSIRLCDMEDYNSSQTQFFESGHITKTSYSRLFIPKIFQRYDKVIYIDADLVVTRDLAELYKHSFNNSTDLAYVVKDSELIRWYHSDPQIADYIDDKVKIKNVLNYFNAGVLLLNTKQLTQENTFDLFLDTLNTEFNNQPKFHDQDILNKVFEGRTQFLDMRWNVLYQVPIFSVDWREKMPASLLHLYIESRSEPYIVHFAGAAKPWQNPSYELAEYFWEYARNTPVYEKILFSNLAGVSFDTSASKSSLSSQQAIPFENLTKLGKIKHKTILKLQNKPLLRKAVSSAYKSTRFAYKTVKGKK